MKAKTVLQNIPATYIIVNKPLKESIQIQSEQHQENLDVYTSGKMKGLNACLSQTGAEMPGLGLTMVLLFRALKS